MLIQFMCYYITANQRKNHGGCEQVGALYISTPTIRSLRLGMMESILLPALSTWVAEYIDPDETNFSNLRQRHSGQLARDEAGRVV